MLNKKVLYARVGENVRVAIPKLFVRCGYPLTAQQVKIDYKKEVEKLVYGMHEVLVRKQESDNEFDCVLAPEWSYSIDNYLQVHLENAACAFILRRENFGGRERKVYELEEPGIEGTVVEIIKKRFVRTGRYSHGYHSSTEGEYEPNGLDDQKAHCIYEVNFKSPVELTHTSSHPIEILATNCTRGISVTG